MSRRTSNGLEGREHGFESEDHHAAAMPLPDARQLTAQPPHTDEAANMDSPKAGKKLPQMHAVILEAQPERSAKVYRLASISHMRL